MDNPGPFLFTFAGGAFPLGAAGVFVGDWMLSFSGIAALSLQATFNAGSGGVSTTVYFQTSLDQGATVGDIAAPQFTTANGAAVANISALNQVGFFTPVSQELTPNTIQGGGALGDRFRAVVVVVGAYASPASLALWGVAR
jgi:hypothetical protein